MVPSVRPVRTSFLAALFVFFLLPSPARAQSIDTMCDTAFQDCRATLMNYIRRETQSIDMAMWFMEDQEMADAIVQRFQAGVSVRAIIDPRRNGETPVNATTLAKFENAGIPMRQKSDGGVLHWKFIIFNGQNVMQFSAANYGDYYFRPTVPYLDYTDEGIYFTNDPPVIDSFRRKFDDTWILTTGFINYANVSGALTRRYPLYTIDTSVMNFVPAENFATRSKPFYDAETQRIDVIMYKITEGTHADGLIRAVQRGVPVRLIVEPDRYRNTGNVWQAYQVDRLYMAGIKIRNRAHAGFLHQKSTLLYSQGLSIFGSSNWTSESNKSQYEHNYFTTKTWFFNWFKANFERKWGNTTGNAETTPFVPLPPDAPVYVSPANNIANVSPSAAMTISWKPGPWAHLADIYFGTSPTPPLIAANVAVSPNTTKTYTLPSLASGKTYYWRVVSKTIAQQTAAGPVYSFTTTGGTQPPGGSDIVLHAADAASITGAWVLESDSTAASGKRIRHPNAGAAKIAAAAASPANSFELLFTAEAGRPYRLWIRGKGDGNSYANDSAFVQFSGSVTSGGAAIYRIGTTSATEFNLEACGGCGISGWGWEDNGWGTGVLGPTIYFASSGAQRLRIQTREDGLAIDQVVLSPSTYLTAPPGAAKNDTIILPKAGGTTPPSAGEIVLYAGASTHVVGNWVVENDSSAAGGRSLRNPNAGAAKVITPAANPSSYFELTFPAEAGRPYRLWIRGKALSDNFANDSVHVQFSNAVTQAGAAAFRIGSNTSTEFNLEACSGCGLANWGWEDNGWGSGVLGPVIYFGQSGTQTIRIQPREDGLAIDQIVLSPSRYLNASPGAAKNDATILSKSQ